MNGPVKYRRPAVVGKGADLKAPTLAKVRAMLEARNPEATLVVTWIRRPRRISYPTGLVGYRGDVQVIAPGYRTTTMSVDADAFGIMVR